MSYRHEENTSKQVDRVRDTDVGLHRARVTQVPDNGAHVVKIVPVAIDAGETVQTGTPKDAIVPVDVYGDVALPDEGSLVVVQKTQNDLFVVRGILYTRQNSGPDYQEGERRIGHAATDSNVRLMPDGSAYVEATGTITVDSGDRVVINGDSDVTIDAGGTTLVVDPSDGTVRVNGGSTGVVTDVSTTKDSDGHVTSISLTRSDDLYVP